MLKDERVASLSEAPTQSQSFYPKIRERSVKDPRKVRERSRKPSKPPAFQAMVEALPSVLPLVPRVLELRACGIFAFTGSRPEACESWRWYWRKEFAVSAKRSFCHELILENTHMKAQKYNQVFQILVSKLIPQIDPHVKIGSAKVLRKKTRKDYTFSLKLAKSHKGNFEQPPFVLCWRGPQSQHHEHQLHLSCVGGAGEASLTSISCISLVLAGSAKPAS